MITTQFGIIEKIKEHKAPYWKLFIDQGNLPEITTPDFVYEMYDVQLEGTNTIEDIIEDSSVKLETRLFLIRIKTKNAKHVRFELRQKEDSEEVFEYEFMAEPLAVPPPDYPIHDMMEDLINLFNTMFEEDANKGISIKDFTINFNFGAKTHTPSD